jgi:hypothetical protein
MVDSTETLFSWMLFFAACTQIPKCIWWGISLGTVRVLGGVGEFMNLGLSDESLQFDSWAWTWQFLSLESSHVEIDCCQDENVGLQQVPLLLAITLQHCACHWSSLHHHSAPCMCHSSGLNSLHTWFMSLASRVSFENFVTAAGSFSLLWVI